MDKNSSFVILNKKDYIAKLENIVKHGIDKGTYVMTENNTIKDLKPKISDSKNKRKQN